MSNSSLVSYTKLSPNRTSPRNHAIDTITIHCVVGQLTAKQILNLASFVNYDGKNGCSCNYAIGCDGSIGLCIDEKDRSWCSSNKSNDHRAITIEVASDTTTPYAVTDAAYKALINLCADICKRNGIKELKWKADKSLIGQVDKQNMTVHRWFANKSCPGDYLYNLHGQIASEVNGILNGTNPNNNQPTQPTMPTSDILLVDGIWGSKTTRRAQQVFGTTVDGIVSNQWACYKEQNPGLAEGFDWQIKPNGKGSQLIKAIQKWCEMSDKDVDGQIGPNTIKAMQKKLRTIRDGYVSKPSNMVKAFQKYLNSK